MMLRTAPAAALLLLASCAHHPPAKPEAAAPAVVVNVATTGESKTAKSPPSSVDEPADDAEPSAEEQRNARAERIAEELAELSNTQILGVLGADPNGVTSVLSGGVGDLDSAGRFGAGGLGLRGTGRGGGGTSAGLAGLGTASGGGARVGHAPAPRTVVTPTGPTVAGSLHKDIIRRVIRRHLAQVRFCYQRELRRDPKIEGKLVVRFAIALDGSVTTATIAESLDPTVDACVKRTFMRMRFPKPHQGVVIVSYPLLFKSGGSAKTTPPKATP